VRWAVDVVLPGHYRPTGDTALHLVHHGGAERLPLVFVRPAPLQLDRPTSLVGDQCRFRRGVIGAVVTVAAGLLGIDDADLAGEARVILAQHAFNRRLQRTRTLGTGVDGQRLTIPLRYGGRSAQGSVHLKRREIGGRRLLRGTGEGSARLTHQDLIVAGVHVLAAHEGRRQRGLRNQRWPVGPRGDGRAEVGDHLGGRSFVGREHVDEVASLEYLDDPRITECRSVARPPPGECGVAPGRPDHPGVAHTRRPDIGAIGELSQELRRQINPGHRLTDHRVVGVALGSCG
jgi:hypothetical protein